ncbi:hypothetical protein JHW43_008038 [Diplocarpon mali]|nr:hypothetical protein JHW43_008038 [Diplocarpon mali]
MAPRKPKIDDDAASTTSTDVPTVLRPKTEKAKVEKAKSDKPKATKPKAPKKEKVEGEKEAKPKAVKKEKAVDTEAGEAVKVAGKGEKKSDGKDKAKPVNGDEAVEVIARYLKEQNRPYSATEISANLHGKVRPPFLDLIVWTQVTKTVADKLLKDMEQNGQIKGKATKSGTGGQWVFWATQDPADSASPEELTRMDYTITTLRESMPALKSSLKILTSKLSTLRSAPTTLDLATAVERTREENEAKAEKLRRLKEGHVKTVTIEEVENVERDLKYWGAKRLARKRAFEYLEAELMNGMSREDIWEKVGVEEDTY